MCSQLMQSSRHTEWQLAFSAPLTARQSPYDATSTQHLMPPTCVFAMPFVQFRHLGSAGGGLQYWTRANMVADGSSAAGLRVLKPLVFDTAKAKQPLVKRLTIYSVYIQLPWQPSDPH
ncbi:hypothetical protein QQF64_029941 [Cirrhinus molitorella]|uniref:Uncharacterized protein n=1 Tax=Cirrhinus molitorella TaxID=172907 RepID=A0ABR3N299_9TELE